MLNAIFAVDSEFGIGKNNSMPWHFPEDFKFFKETTINSTIVMGNNTWLSLPKRPLPDRYNVVITSLYEHSVHKDADLVITSDKLYFSTGVVRRRYSILLANEIKQLGVKISRAESVSTTSFEVETPATVILRDSIIFDTIPVKHFNYDDGFFEIQGTAIGNQQQLNLAYRDTLVQVVYRGEREIPWLWIFSPRKLMQRVSLKNPNAQIEYTQHIEIED